jgi:hypothetical protein
MRRSPRISQKRKRDVEATNINKRIKEEYIEKLDDTPSIILMNLHNIGGDYDHFKERCHHLDFVKRLDWCGPGDITDYVNELIDEFWKFLILKRQYHFINIKIPCAKSAVYKRH